MSGTPSTSELWVLNKILELYERFGASPIESEITFDDISGKYPDSKAWYTMTGFPDSVDSLSEEEGKKVQKIRDLLGLDEFDNRQFETLDEVKKVIDHALSVAPRARSR